MGQQIAQEFPFPTNFQVTLMLVGYAQPVLEGKVSAVTGEMVAKILRTQVEMPLPHTEQLP